MFGGGILSILRVFYLPGLHHPAGQRTRLRPVPTQRTIPVHQRAALGQDVHDPGRPGVGRNLLWKDYNRCSRWLEKSNSECLRSSKYMKWSVSSLLSHVCQEMDICGWLWNSTVGLNSLGFSGKNSRKKQVFFFGGITFKVYRFLPLSECRAFLLNLLKAEMTESEEALTVSWDGEVSESYQTAKLTSGRLLDLGTRLVMEPGSAAHCSGVCCFWNSSLQNTCGMLFSPFFITGKVLFQFLPVGERGTAVGLPAVLL